MQWKQEYINTVKTLAKQGLSSSKIGEAMFEQYNINFAGRTIRKYAQGIGKDTTNVRGVELTINQDGSQTSITRIQMTSEQAKDPDFVLRAHGFVSAKWDIISLKNNFWQMGSKDSDPVDLYQSKITVKPRVVKFNIDDLIETLNRNVKPIEVENIQQGETSLVISLFDLHFGITKLNMLKSHINQIGNILKKGYKRVEIIVGGDVLHSDFITKTQTASNTQLDHVKTIKALNEAESFISTIIEMSLQYSPTVEVKAVSGNHDT
ncbi:MAG: helix-turn-helix domain-containing protein, partial [Leuconostoc mesenteroides]